MNIQLKEILKFKNKENKELDNITSKLPPDEEICQEILTKLGNNSNFTIKKDEQR